MPNPHPVVQEKAQFSPLYRQIKALLLRGLEASEWKPGEALPSELELAKRFGVSPGTVRKAMDELSTANLVIRRQGKGTFVATHREAQAQFRFLRLRSGSGVQRQTETQLIECRRQRASADLARVLELKTGEGIVFIRRVLWFDGEPTVLDEISLPGGFFRGLTQEKLANWNGSIYNLFEVEFGIRMIRANEQLRAVSAGPEAAQFLDIKENTPLLCVDRRSYTYGERPVEFRRGLYRTDRYFYANSLS